MSKDDVFIQTTFVDSLTAVSYKTLHLATHHLGGVLGQMLFELE